MNKSYVTYAISDPRSKLFFYVGISSNFERRKKEHLTAYRLKNPPRGTVKAWLKQMHADGYTPHFTIIDIHETEIEAKDSENRWVEKLAEAGHPLYNGWLEHKDLIGDASQGVGRTLEAKIFIDGKAELVGHVEPNNKKTGYRVHLDEGVEITGPITIDLLPPKDD